MSKWLKFYLCRFDAGALMLLVMKRRADRLGYNVYMVNWFCVCIVWYATTFVVLSLIGVLSVCRMTQKRKLSGCYVKI